MSKDFNFRLDKIEFENYKGYKERQVFDFTTNRSFSNDYSTVRKYWDYSKTKTPKKYKRVLGIYGYNSSGKTSIFEIISLWMVWILELNKNYFNSLEQKNNKPHFHNYFELLILKYSHDYNDENSFELYSSFNDKNRPLIISFYFSTNIFSFRHELIGEYDDKEKEIINISERIYLLDSYDNEIVKLWDSDTTPNSLGEEIQLLELLEKEFSKQNLEKDSENKQETLLLLKNLQRLRERNQKNDEKLKTIWKCIFKFLNSVTIIDPAMTTQKNNLNIQLFFSSLNGIDSINNYSTKIYNLLDGGKDEKITKVKNIILSMIKILDSNIKDIQLLSIRKGEKETIKFISIVNKNNVKNFPEELSTGTINFIDLLLKVIYSKWINEVKKGNNVLTYIFIDELGLNWHTNLTINFINNMLEDFMDENSTIVFTSHDSFVANNLSTDSLYIIDNKNNLIKVDGLTNNNDDKFRKRIKFSKNYFNNKFDSHWGTSENDDNFSELKKAITVAKNK